MNSISGWAIALLIGHYLSPIAEIGPNGREMANLLGLEESEIEIGSKQTAAAMVKRMNPAGQDQEAAALLRPIDFKINQMAY